jgi:uncharacterized protein
MERIMSASPSDVSFDPDLTTDKRIDTLDWRSIESDLDARGCAHIRQLLSPEECATVTKLYDSERLFRNTIVMARHNFGRGEYRYFNYPLPSLVDALRTALYRRLVPIATRWCSMMQLDTVFPVEHADFIERCRASGQTRPTPLLLKYSSGDYNCLHQDLYGAHVFPLQVAILLSQPRRDFHGGEFVLTEQRPRMQSRVEVVSLEQGDAVVFAVHQRPVAGSRGSYRVNMRHGVSRLHSGHRHTLGVIFHDAS